MSWIRSLNVPWTPLIKQSKWSIAIGIYEGTDPFHLGTPEGRANPVLTEADVSDVPAIYVADPFMVRRDGIWHMFFEVLNAATGKGEIALATSGDALEWTYRRVVLAEPFHMAYPHVFTWRGKDYMIPETCGTSTVRLYEATDFPGEWRFVRELISDGNAHSDASIISHDGRLWLFVLRGSKDLALFSADELTGEWVEHPRSPVISGNPHITRPGGRMLALGDALIRYTQDCYPTYGSQVRAFAVTILSGTDYAERRIDPEAVLKASGRGWNRDGMHHIDAHEIGPNKWIACVDGLREGTWHEHARRCARTVRTLLRTNGLRGRASVELEPAGSPDEVRR